MSTDVHIARIVLVDDSETDNFFLEIAIWIAGFSGECRSFEKAQDALDFLVKDRISVSTMLLLDINMPGMTGFELAQALNTELQPLNRLHVHMLTSSAWSEDMAVARSIPLVGRYLLKPLTRAMAARLLTEMDASTPLAPEHLQGLIASHVHNASNSALH